jgi:hypothetical protein
MQIPPTEQKLSSLPPLGSYFMIIVALSKLAPEVTFVTSVSDVPGLNLRQDTNHPN